MPATLSRPVITGLLREDLGFDGLVYTDSMSMAAVAKMGPPGEAAVRSIAAGADIVLHPPDAGAAIEGVRAAIERGELPAARVNRSARRLLTAKARLDLHRERAVDLEEVAAKVGGRAHLAVARAVSERAVTLVKDERRLVPLSLPVDASVLVLSVLDYPSGWRIAAPARTFIPALRERWPDVTAIELSDRSTREELELVRAMADRFDAVVVAVFVRAASGSGRLDLAEGVARLLRDLGRTMGVRKPVVTALFGNPYAAAWLQELPAVLLTYDFGDVAEESAVRAIAGEIPIGGRLPVAIPGLAEVGFGLMRGASP